MSGYLYYYHNHPFADKIRTLRLAVAPVYLDSEYGIKGGLGGATDLGIGLSGGGFADIAVTPYEHDIGPGDLDTTLALALSDQHDGLVGRVLAFSGRYAAWPDKAPALTTIHLLHGQLDNVVPARLAQQGYAELMALGADATCDIASSIGHELHPALMAQAVHRLQTCVPLRFWRSA